MNSRMARFAFTVFLLLLCRPAFSAERITHYQSDITVAETGQLTVRETIEVDVEGIAIRHGIFRDLPATLGRIEVQEVTLDGRSEPFAREGMGGNVRLRIGSADRTVSKGRHVYTLTYRTRPQIRFFETYDQFYWNVTGNGWTFPIDLAEATVHLPREASILEPTFYTGAVGSKAQNAQATKRGESEAHFETTTPLGSGEGLTIVVGFSKGVVRQPTTVERVTAAADDQAVSAVALIGILLLLAYYIVLWRRINGDSAPKRVVAISRPPQGFTPAAVRFNTRMKYDTKTFIVAMVGIAVKGFWTISTDEGVYKLTRTGKSENEARLSSDERAVAGLVADIDEITLRNTNSGPISNAIGRLTATLKQANQEQYFTWKLGVWARGLVLVLLTLLAMILVSRATNSAITPVHGLALFLQVGLALVFLPLFKVRTPAGVRLREQIAGFRLFLSSPGGDVTQEAFEEFLPYAMALDVEDAWSRRFSGAATGQNAASDFTYSPLWFTGDPYPMSSAYLFSAGMASSVDSARVDPTAAASTSDTSGWSAGADGGGGGFSGGGDGGGGGGGW